MAPWNAFVGPSYTLAAHNAAVQRAVNLYLEVVKVEGEPTQKVLYGRPGLDAAVTLEDAPVRGCFAQDGRAWVAAGATLYELSNGSTLSAVRLGTIARDNRPVYFASNGIGGNQLMLTSGGSGYTLGLTSGTFAQITDVSFPANVTTCGILDGFGIVLAGGSFYLSSLEDFSAWDATDKNTRSSTADLVRSMLVVPPLLVLFGSEVTSLYYNSGAASTPFVPVSGVSIPYGIGPIDSACIVDGAPMWLSAKADGARLVLRLQGNQAVRVSTHAVEQAIRQYTTVDEAIGWTCQHDGHTFYVLSFPSAGATWVYDLASQSWTEWPYWNTSTGQEEAHLGRCHMLAFGQHLVGSRIDGRLFTQSLDLYDDDGEAMRWLRRSPHLGTRVYEVSGSDPVRLAIAGADLVVRQGVRCLFHDRFHLRVDGGVGLTSGQGADPQIMLRVSDDSAQTWDDYRQASLGEIGQYGADVYWTRLGRAPVI